MIVSEIKKKKRKIPNSQTLSIVSMTRGKDPKIRVYKGKEIVSAALTPRSSFPQPNRSQHPQSHEPTHAQHQEEE
jgi:hypothetical protein